MQTVHIKRSTFYFMTILIMILLIAIINHLVKLFMINDFAITNGRLLFETNKVKLDDFLQPSGRRYIFIDLGSNNGDSVYNFFNEEQKYPKILDSNIVNIVKWEIFAFEANPIFDEPLIKMKTEMEKKKQVVHLFNRTAAWTYDGYIDFYLDTINEKYNFYGSSLKQEHPDVRNGKSKVNVACVDIGKLVKSFNKNDFVVIKMDIEGAEYDLLTHFILNNVLHMIDFMAIEYHKDVSYFKTPEQVFNYILNSGGIRLFKWV